MLPNVLIQKNLLKSRKRSENICLNIELLHKESISKTILSEGLIDKYKITNGYATSTYHYTSPECLMRILKNRNVYFTDCQFLNDYKERLNINDELEYFWNSKNSNYDKGFRKLLENIYIDVFEDDDFCYIDGEEEQKMNRYFVMSASMQKDSLGMWKYYSKNGSYNGYCISLFISALDDEWIDRDTDVAVEIGLVYIIIQINRKK